MPRAATIFRTPRWLPLFLGLVGVATAIGTVFLFRQQQFGGLSIGFVAFTLVVVLGIVDSLLTRVELREDALVFVARFRRRRIPRGEIASVTWESGSGVSIKLVRGGWIKLPDTGNSQSRANSIRAWLGKTRS